ncbi:DUF2945 domain-containing protein [bacterium]|nr:DUF2945 domain-containing protein [bacterium]
MNKIYELDFYNSILAALKKAKAGTIKRGDSVSWSSSGGTARGKVTKVITIGEEQIPGSSFTITGTKDDPGALIRVYRPDSSGVYKPTDTIVGHKISTLTKIEAL